MGGQAPGPLPGTGKQKGVLLTLPWVGWGVLKGAVGFTQGNPQEFIFPSNVDVNTISHLHVSVVLIPFACANLEVDY